MSAFNQLTDAEVERLAILSEEMGEAQKAIGKILRHGYNSYNPDDPNGPGNRESLQLELGDVHAAMEMLVESGDISKDGLVARVKVKREKMKQYLHHQSDGAHAGTI